MEALLEQLHLILAVALAMSEALALIPALKENSLLQLAMRVLRKAKELFPKKKQAEKLEEPSDDAQ